MYLESNIDTQQESAVHRVGPEIDVEYPCVVTISIDVRIIS